MRHILVAAVVAGLVLPLSYAPISAQPSHPAVALVLEVSGTTDPALRPFRELRAGDRVTLERGARLVVLHYDRECRMLTIDGGAVTFRQRGEPVVKDGAVSSREGKCPRRLEARSTAGAVIMRSAAAKLSARPSFTIGGARAVDVASVRVLDAEQRKPLMQVPVENGQFRYPVFAAPLETNRHYTLEFVPATGDKPVASLDVFIGETGPADEPLALVLVD